MFMEYIRSEGLRETTQRTLILNTFLKTSQHVSVEDVYRMVNRDKRQVGYATVHRTMKLISGCGLAREVMFDDGIARFENIRGRRHHHHLVCTRCRRVIEFTSEVMDRVEQDIVTKHRFRPLSHHYEIFGLCWECRKKDRDSDAV